MRLLFVLAIVPSFLFAQIDISKNKTNAWIIAPNFTFQFPAMDMAKSYGWNSNIGLNLWYKTSKNVILGIEANFLTGGIVNNPYALGDAANSNGTVIGKDGQEVEYILNERGISGRFQIGKIIKTWIKPNPNSGILLMGGIGYIDHKIYIDIDNLIAKQFTSDYITGYDKKCAGLLLSGFLGYMYMSNNKTFNMYIGMEAMMGFTKNIRAWDFVENKKIDDARKDFLIGPKAALVISIYKKGKQEVYYYQ